nr:GNAT family N-acetyltransferase [Sedimentibacter sp.]
MVRKLIENDKNIILNYLKEEATFNLFIIGDILNTGFDKSFMELWGEFDQDNNLTFVLLRYFNNFIPYYKEPYYGDLDYFKQIIRENKNKKLISGKSDIVNKFKGVLINCKEKHDYFCTLIDRTKLLTSFGDTLIKRATIDDVDRISDFIDSIEELGTSGENREMLGNTIKTCSGRYYYIEDEKGDIISVAGTSAENKFAAMVVSVATDKKYRKRGLATKCVSRLCDDALNDCEKLCLFYDNPNAGKIYHAIGFETIGNWTMLVEK